MDGDDFRREQPNDIEAEKFTLSAMIGAGAAIDDVAEILGPDDFYRPAHQVIYQALVSMRMAGAAITVVTLKDEIERHQEIRALGGPRRGPILLHELWALHQVPQTAAAHAGIVFDKAVRRRAVERARRVIDAAYSADQDPADVAAAAAAEFAAVPDLLGGGDQAGKMMTAAEFAKLDTVRTEPVINGLLHREDRVIIVAEEGHGKSYLSAQVAFCGAAGVNPFRREIRYPGRRALLIDFENPRSEVRDRMEFFGALARRYAGFDEDNILVWSWPEGVDLRSGRDAHMVAEQIRRARPDIVCAGPVYNMIADTGEHSEQTHSTVTRFWNKMRGRYGFALWLEHHPPLAQGGRPRLMRPQGSGVYSRWPEFGRSLVRTGENGVVRLDRFRGDRIKGRSWPAELARYEYEGRDWPWYAVKWDPKVLAAPLEEVSLPGS